MNQPVVTRLTALLLALPACAWAQTDADAASADTSTLPVMRARSPNETATGPVHGYVARRASSATKTDAPLIETPQAISVVTREQFEEQGATTLRQTTAYTAGVISAYFDSRVDSFSARGGTVAQYLDGLLRSYGSYNTARPDPFTLERVEMVRGPASVLYGQGNIGGVLNLVSKRPQAERQGELQLQLGNYGRKQIAADLTGPVGDSTQWLYRVVAVLRDSGTQVNQVADDRLVLAPSLTWQPSAATSLTVQALHQRDKSGSLIGFFPWQGTVLANAAGQIPTSSFIGEPGWDAYNANQDALGYLLSHQVNDQLTLRQNLRYTRSEVDYRTAYTSFAASAATGRPARPVFNADGRSVARDLVQQLNGSNMLVLDNQAEAKLNFGPWQHTLLLGLDAQRNKSTAQTGNGVAAAIDVYAPVYGNFTAPKSLTASPTVTQRQTGLYLQDHLKFDQRWVAVLGLRHDLARTDTENRPAARVDDQATTKRAGLLYLADGGWSPFLSYSESFLPLGGLNAYGVAYKPQRGKQWEGGLKWQPQNQRMSASLTVYSLHDSERKTSDPANPLNSLQLGEVRVRGLELEGRGSLAQRWDWTLAYAYTDTLITRSNGGDQGLPMSNVPRHTGSAWLTHQFALGGLQGLRAGAGLRYLGGSYSGTYKLNASAPVLEAPRTPSSTLLDLMLGYDRGDWRYALNVVNLADKVQITQCLARGDCFYGQRRTVVATATRHF